MLWLSKDELVDLYRDHKLEIDFKRYAFLYADDKIHPLQERNNKKKRLDRVELRREICNRR